MKYLTNSYPEGKLINSQQGIWKEYLLTTILGAIPNKPGNKLRHLFYRSIFGQIGTKVSIYSHVKLMGASNVEIGTQVIIKHGAYISARPQSRIVIGNHAVIKDNVYLLSQVENATIVVQEKVRLDHHVDIRIDAASPKPGYIEIGSGTYIGPYTCIGGPGPVKIGKDCLIASHCGIYGNNHNFSDPTHKINEQGLTCQGITIGDDCWLGTGVKVLDGVRISQGCVIGAGAVVTKDLPPYSIAVGMPAKIISQRRKVEAGD